MTRFVLFVALLVPSIASAQYRGDVPLGDTLNFTFNTVGSDGAPITIAGTPAIEVYEEGSITQITAGTTLTEDFAGVTGLHNVAIVATGANGYEAGKWYDVVIAGTTPTADSVSILGRTLGSFRVVVAENVSGTPAVDVELIEGTAASSSLASAADIVNEWETQSQADPTGFHVNVMEVGGTAQTANDNGADINAILVDTATLPTATPINHDGNNATSFDTLETAIEGGSAGDVFIVGGGTYDGEGASISVPAGVTVIGSGRGVTRIISDGVADGTPVLTTGTNCRLKDLTVDGLSGNEAVLGGVAVAWLGVAHVNVHCENVEFIGQNDAMIYTPTSGTRGDLYFENCRFEARNAGNSGSTDNIIVTATTGTGVAVFRNCEVFTDGGTQGEATGIKGGGNGNSFVYFSGGRIDVVNTTNNATCMRIDNVAGTTEYYAQGTTFRSRSTSGTALDLNKADADATLAVSNCDYSTSKTSGTITVLGSDRGSLATSLVTIDTNVDDIETDTGTTLPALFGTPVGASVSADIAAVKAETATIVSDTNELQTDWANGGRLDLLLDTAAAGGGGGGSTAIDMQSTTIATLASQTSFTLTAGSADDNAYPAGSLVFVTDQSTSTQKCVGLLRSYTGATKTVTLAADPGIFTMATGDTVDIVYLGPPRVRGN